MKKFASTTRAGFTIIDSTVVVAVLAIVAIFAVPRIASDMERGKTSDAFTYLAQVESAQARFHSDQGSFSPHVNRLDVRLGKPDNFRVSQITSLDWTSEWQLRLTRLGHDSGYGEYTVVFDQDGFSSIKSSVPAGLRP